MWSRVKSLFNVVADNSALNRARYAALSSQIPLMYAIVLVNMIGLVITHYSYAPLYLTLPLPIILLPFTIYRSWKILCSREAKLSNSMIAKRLTTINILSAAIGIVCVIWALTLFNYGNAYTQGHAAFFICLTSIAVITCLMHLRQAGLLMFTTVLCPTALYFMMQEHLVFKAIAVNILLVSGTMLFIMFRYSQAYTELINKQSKLQQQSKILKILGDENMRLANLDTLTTIPNRRHFFSELAKRIQSREGTGEPLVVGILDLDGFKQINDIFGHPAGDKLLIDASQRLLEVVDDDVFVARLGGDEFGLIIENPGSERDVTAMGNFICDALQEPFQMKEGSAQVAGTIGFAFYPEAAETTDLLFERADYALYYSKQNHKGTVGIFSEEHETAIRAVSSVAHYLKDADLDKELDVHFQPIYNTTNGTIAAFEALARWESPHLGFVPPNIFINSAEQSGLVSRLTNILFGKSLHEANKWPSHIGLSFNLSTYDLCSPDSILNMLNQIEKSGFDASRITFEITETAVMQDFNRATHGLSLIRQMGSKIALDDFGTGYSSLSYLPRMPIDRLKVDRSFIIDIETSEAKKDIMRTIRELCHNLKLECVVEGVEDETQYNILSEMGYNLIQGYYFSRPVTIDQLPDIIASNELETTMKVAVNG